MYRKIIAAILCAAAMVGFAPAVSADIIWEPSKKDRFFHDHYDDMVNASQRSYNITKDTDIYEDPDGKIVGSVKAGSEQVIYYKYTDKHDVLWGGFYDTSDYDNILWINLDDFEVIYDYISFNEEHADEIYPYDNSYGALDSEEPLTFYEYPYSKKSDVMEYHPEDWTSYIQSLYKDENSVWGYISYMWGEKGWVMLENISVTVTEATEQSTIAKTEQETTAATEQSANVQSQQDTAIAAETTTVTEQETTSALQETTTTALTTQQETTAASELTSDTETTVTTEIRTVDKPVSKGSSLALAGILAAAAAGVSAVLLIIFGKKKK